MNTAFPLTWKYLQNKDKEEDNIYIKENKIPLGTKRPYYEYEKGEISERDIVYIYFDPITKQTTERKPFNGLIIGSAGDGKSSLLKNIWFFIQKAGYYCIYIDSKSTESGRARIGTRTGLNRLPPKIKPEGIKLKHYIPSFATRNFDHMIHNFDIYSIRLHNITEKEMLQGLGMTKLGAMKIDGIIKSGKDEGEVVTTKSLLKNIEYKYNQKEINHQSFTSMYSIISDLDYHLINDKYKELDMLKDFKDGKSICISYNACSFIWLSFDVGLKIYQAVRFFHDNGNRIPIMFFFDDSSFYAVERREILKYNLAVEEIKNIGFNYRSVGIYNFLAVQSLSIVDDRVSESYKIKIITPSFNNPDSLSSINVPKRAIDMLKNNKLMIDRINHVMEYILIREDNSIETFFPFLSPCNHFEEVYKQKI